MKIYLDTNVWDAALERIRYIFDEFPNIVVGFSGGKDSTVTMQLALIVATEKNRLPLNVFFIDQEAEWQCTIDYITEVAKDPRINFTWLQSQIKINSATSTDTENEWLHCWQPNKKEDWIREKVEGSEDLECLKGVEFADIFKVYFEHRFPNEKACYLAGVRTEESPARFCALTTRATYKHVTYGKQVNKAKNHYTFYPLYDWRYIDIWKAISDNDWLYCKLYDLQYQYGRTPMNMRVSHVHHETATHDLLFMQEIEPLTWSKLVKRVSGINAVKHLKSASKSVPKELPEAFVDWKEYRDYLLEHLIETPIHKETFRKKFAEMDVKYDGMKGDGRYKIAVVSILLNDWLLTKIKVWEIRPECHSWRQWKYKGIAPRMKNQFI